MRLYQIEVNLNPDLNSLNWTNDLTFGVVTPDVETTTSRTVTSAMGAKRLLPSALHPAVGGGHSVMLASVSRVADRSESCTSGQLTSFPNVTNVLPLSAGKHGGCRRR